MESYKIKSIIAEIAGGIEDLIGRGVICTDRKLLLYGLDRYAFAMRTILANLGYHNVEGYLSDDEAQVLRCRADMENFSCRFLAQEAGLLRIWRLEERLEPFDSGVAILVASKSYGKEKAKLEALGYEEHIHFYSVYDFRDQELEAFFADKKKMSLPEIKQAEKEMLAYVDRLCRKHGIRYWVCGGTLLGTIRHQGFIPWDDDIDIFLPLKDYRKLIDLFREKERAREAGYYGMLGFGTSENNDFADLLAKIVDKRTIVAEDIGTVRKVNPLWIDVFPLVGMPEDPAERHLFFAGYREMNRKMWREFYAANGRVDLFGRWYAKQKEYISRYDFDGSEYVGVLGAVYGERDCTHKRVYAETLRMPFEDIEVNVPVGYEEYLDILYGAWRRLPEKHERKTRHDMLVYWNQAMAYGKGRGNDQYYNAGL